MKALITGASSGIGAQLARLLAERGTDLILHGRDLSRLQALQQEIGDAQLALADLSDPVERAHLIALVRSEVPDLLINAAGFGLYGPALGHPIREQVALLDVDASALLELTLEAAKALCDRGQTGTILNISSAAGFFAIPNMATYAAAKACVTSFSLALDQELKRRGVRVLVACPGMVRTDFQRRAAKNYPFKQTYFGTMSVKKASLAIMRQIDRKKSLVVFDWRYRFGSLFGRCLPLDWVGKLIGGRLKGRYSMEKKT